MVSTSADYMSDREKKKPTLSPVAFIVLTDFTGFKTMEKKRKKTNVSTWNNSRTEAVLYEWSG